MSLQPRRPMIDPFTGLPIPMDTGVDPTMGFPSPAQPNFMSKLTSALGGPQGLMNFGASLLAQSGPSPVKQGFGSILGQSILGNQQFQQQQADNQLKQMLLMSQIQRAQRGPKQGKPVAVVKDGKTVYVTPEEAVGLEVPKGIGNQAELPADIQGYNLAKSQGFNGSYLDYIDQISKARVGAPFTPMTSGGVPGFGNRQDASFTPTSTLPTEIDAAARAREAEARAAELAKAQAGRDATFQEDINVIDDEILRTQRLLSEFKAGKYQTGPVAGRLPNFRTSAQDLQREQGRDVIKAISSATFGALSEGERAFLRELGISENSTEESNINMLTERLEKLQRTKNRLQTRGRLGVGPNAAPAVGGSNIDSLLDKYAPK